MRPSKRLALLVWCVFSMTCSPVVFCDLGTRREDYPKPTPAPRPTPWWPTPDYSAWPTATPKGE
jgi:hypothetical protein